MSLKYEPASEPMATSLGAQTELEEERQAARLGGLNSSTLHPALYTLQPTPYTLYPAPYTLHPAPYTLHPDAYTLYPMPFTLHPTP